MKRREFLNWVGFGMLASSLPVAIAACQSSQDSSALDSNTPESSQGNLNPQANGFATVGNVADLDTAGFIAAKDFMGTQVVVIRAPNDATSVLAVNSLCTHEGCNVEWDGTAGLFDCPCHGSKFNSDGSVIEGPATTPLGTYEAKIEEDLVLVKVS